MYPIIHKSHRISFSTVSYYSRVIDHCLSLKSLSFAKVLHAQLVKVGFNTHTFLGNRYLDLYSRLFGPADDILRIFGDIAVKNTISWNICLKCMMKVGRCETARYLFDKMPERDVVSWNSIISGYSSHGYTDSALGIFREMQNMSVRPSPFTYSIVISIVFHEIHGRELHGRIVRSGLSIHNVVIGNSLIDMYGKLGNVENGFRVFSTMEEPDIISWNSLIIRFCKLGYGKMGLHQFRMMRSLGFSCDEFTCSAVITSCCHLRNLEKGKQIFAFCVKTGFLCNSIVSSAAIDLFSKCSRLDDAVQLFRELDQWDSAVCNSMISSYGGNGFELEALQLFVLSLRKDIRPTEFTISSILSSVSDFSAEQGTQVHSLAIKLGLELDDIVASSFVEMYSNCGSIDSAIKIFKNIEIRDLVCWNTMIAGLAENGRLHDALVAYNELLHKGLKPDEITLAGVLSACRYGCFADEGIAIFTSMQERFGISPRSEHYSCIVDLLCEADMIDEAVTLIEAMPWEPDSSIWRAVLNACGSRRNLKGMELVAERLMDLEPVTSLPYLVLARVYEIRGQWEKIVWVKRRLKEKNLKDVVGCSRIGIKNQVYVFWADQLNYCGEEQIYSVLKLIDRDTENEHCFCDDDCFC